MSFTKATITQGEKALEWANRWHQTVVLWTIAGAVFVLALAVLANMAGFPKLNFVLAAASLVIGIFFLTKPLFVLSVFGLGSLANGLPDTKLGEILRNGVESLPNFELEKMLGAGWDAIKATVHQVAHVFFFLTVLFVVLGTFPISNPTLVLPAIVILAGIGIWAALFTKDHVWYGRITVGILVLSGVVVFFKMYDHASRVERIEEARAAHQEQLVEEALTPMLRKAENGIKLTKEEVRILDAAKKREESRSIAKRVETFIFGRTIEYRVPSDIAPENLKPICGIPPGEYRLEVSDGSRLGIGQRGQPGVSTIALTGRADRIARTDQLRRQDYRPYGFMLNGSGHDEMVAVAEDGCLFPSFNLTFEQEGLFRNGQWLARNSTILFVLKGI